MSHKRKVRNSTHPHSNIPSLPKGVLIDKLYIDFTQYPHWLDSIDDKNFNNVLKDEKEAAKQFYFFIHHFLPEVEEMGKDIFSSSTPHCHPLRNKKRDLACKIILKIDNINLNDEVNLWQLSAKDGRNLRIIGSIVTDKIYIFYPLFIDYHHLLYPSNSYNQMDVKNFSFKPQEKYK